MTDSVTNQDDLEAAEADIPAEDDAGEEQGVEEEAPTPVPDETPPADEIQSADESASGDVSDESAPEETEDPSALDRDAILTTLQEDFEDLNDRHLRLAAEFNNYRRRVEQERLDLWSRAQAEMVGQLLDMLDDLQRVAGLDLTNATVEGIMEGIDLVERKFVRALDDAGAEAFDPVGEAFDPERMEAMMRVPAESEDDDDTVAQVFQKGYVFKGHLVRVARVSVLKHG